MTYLSDLVDPYKRALADEHLREEIAADALSRHPRVALLREYGLTVAEYDALVARHAGNCGACGKPFGDDFVIDHCHLTGTVRGLLHGTCNSALGFAKDSPATLRALAAYLERSR